MKCCGKNDQLKSNPLLAYVLAPVEVQHMMQSRKTRRLWRSLRTMAFVPVCKVFTSWSSNDCPRSLAGQRQVRGPVCPSRMVRYPEEFNCFKQSTSFLWPLRFVRVFRVIRGEKHNRIFTTDYTEYTEKSNGRAYHEA